MPTREETIRKGARLPSPRLVEQAEYSLALAREEAAALAPLGWTDARTAEVAALAAEVARRYAEQASAREDVPRATVEVAFATREAKAWKRRLLLAAANALGDEPEVLDDFHAGAVIGDSTPRLIGYLGRAVPLAERHAAALAEWGGKELAARGRALSEALRAADAAQELRVASLPSATAELYLAKGRLHDRLKKLSRTGRALHDGDAAAAARYALDIVLRPGAKRPAAAPPPASAAPA